jgi:ABC-type microcin C transport system permease subunit YejB
MPVSISLGLWSTLIMYLVSIPLGIAKATRHGSHFRRVDQLGHHRRLCDTRRSCSPFC